MPHWLYTLRKRFTSDNEASWQGYLSFSGFLHITELISLDAILCPNLIGPLRADDWLHNLPEFFYITLIHNGNYLVTRQPIDPPQSQVLAILEYPDGSETVPTGYTVCGFDIVDEWNDISALTNCGPIPEAFTPSMVNQWGLLPDLATALKVRDKLQQLAPDEPHFHNREIWRIARALIQSPGKVSGGS